MVVIIFIIHTICFKFHLDLSVLACICNQISILFWLIPNICISVVVALLLVTTRVSPNSTTEMNI